VQNELRILTKKSIIENLINAELEHNRILQLLYDIHTNSSGQFSASNYNYNSQNYVENKLEIIFSCIKELIKISNSLIESLRSFLLNSSNDSALNNYESGEISNVGAWFLRNFNPIKNSASTYAQNIEYLNKYIENKVNVYKFLLFQSKIILFYLFHITLSSIKTAKKNKSILWSFI
jgi:hypothetical protein